MEVKGEGRHGESGASAVEEYPNGYKALRVVPGMFRLLGSSVLARTASRTYVILLVLFVLDRYKSPTMSGLVVLASQIPGLVGSPVAGALLDRRRRLTLIRLDFFTASSAIALITVLDAVHLLPVWSLYVIVILASLTQPLSVTGTRSLFPLIVPRPLWDRANGLDGSSFVVSSIFGPMIAGFAVAVAGPRWGLLVPVVLYLAAGIALLGVHVPDPARREGSVFRSAADALHYVFTNKTLRQLSAVSTVYNGCTGTLSVVIPVLVVDHLHGGSTTVGVMLAVIGVGGSISSMAMGAIGTTGREHNLMRGACITAGLAIAATALVFHNELLCFVMFFIVGLTNGPMNIPVFGVRQRVTHQEWFGRAFAISMSLNGVGTPIGAAIVGAVISHSIALGFLFGGIGTLFAAGWSIAFPFEVYDVEPEPSSVEIPDVTEAAGGATPA